MGHDRGCPSNTRGFDSYRLLTLSLAALMTRISSVVIEGAHTSALRFLSLSSSSISCFPLPLACGARRGKTSPPHLRAPRSMGARAAHRPRDLSYLLSNTPHWQSGRGHTGVVWVGVRRDCQTPKNLDIARSARLARARQHRRAASRPPLPRGRARLATAAPAEPSHHCGRG